jgi:hypothetical protein
MILLERRHDAALFHSGRLSGPHPSGRLSPSDFPQNILVFQMDFLREISGVKTGRRNENRDQIAGSKIGGIMPPLW